MMTAPLKHISPGDILPTAASVHNAFVDAANAHRATQYRLRGMNRGTGMPAEFVLVRNDTWSMRYAHEIVGLDDILTKPVNTNGDHYRINNAPSPLLSAVRPLIPTSAVPGHHIHRWAVLAEPLQPGAIGRAWVSGLHWVVCSMTSYTPRKFASVLNNQTDYLIGSHWGVPIVGMEPTPMSNYYWAAVVLGQQYYPVLSGTLSAQWKAGDPSGQMLVDGDDPLNDGSMWVSNFLDKTASPYQNGYPSGTKLIAAWSETNNRYQVVAIDQ